MSANVLLTESLGVELHSDPWPEDVTLYQTFNVSTMFEARECDIRSFSGCR